MSVKLIYLISALHTTTAYIDSLIMQVHLYLFYRKSYEKMFDCA